MANLDDNVNIILSHEAIVEKAKEKWNSKGSSEKIRSGHKYRHIFEKLNLPFVDWDNSFKDLSKSQISILIKGELIRTYDSMPNKQKTKIKEHFGLSSFSSKWFKLPSCDKKILLNSVLKHEEQKK